MTAGCTKPPPPDEQTESANENDEVARELIDGLRSATTLTLYSLKPYQNWEESDEPDPFTANFEQDGDEWFLGWSLLGSIDVAAPEIRGRLIDAFEASIHVEDYQAACFFPRHGIRATDGATTYNAVICFECGYCDWYVDRESRPTVLLSSGGRKTFNAILTEAGVAIDTSFD